MVCWGRWDGMSVSLGGGGGEVAVADGEVWRIVMPFASSKVSGGWAAMLGECKAAILYVKREIKVRSKGRVKRLRKDCGEGHSGFMGTRYMYPD